MKLMLRTVVALKICTQIGWETLRFKSSFITSDDLRLITVSKAKPVSQFDVKYGAWTMYMLLNSFEETWDASTTEQTKLNNCSETM